MSGTTPIHNDATSATNDRRSSYHRLRSDAQRRTTMRVLSEASRDLTIEELADRVSDRSPVETPVDRIEIRLHHAHLPMLDDADVVDYDQETGQVSLVEPVTDLLTSQ